MSRDTTKTSERLTERQERFCIEYVLNKGNASEAARRAGYSEDRDEQSGYENLRIPKVIARIAELREESGMKTGANIEWMESMLVSAIERCSQRQEIVNEDGVIIGYKFDAKGLAANASILIKLKGWDEKKEQPKETLTFSTPEEERAYLRIEEEKLDEKIAKFLSTDGVVDEATKIAGETANPNH